MACPSGRLTPGDHVGLCLDVDGTVHRHGSIFVEALALVPYASDLRIDDTDRASLREVLGAVAAYAGGDRSRRRWLGALRVCDALAAIGFERPVARALAGLIRRRAKRASSSSAGNTGDYRAMQRRILDRYGAFLDGRRRERIERAFEQVVTSHLRVDPATSRTLADFAESVELDVVLVTDVPTHVARPYAGLLGEGVDVVGTDFETAEGRFTGDYAFVEKGPAVEALRAERGWDYTLTAGDSGNDLPMAAVADLFLAVDGRGTVREQLPADYRTVETRAVRSGSLSADTDAVLVPRTVSFADALRTTMDGLGVEAPESAQPGQAGSEG